MKAITLNVVCGYVKKVMTTLKALKHQIIFCVAISVKIQK